MSVSAPLPAALIARVRTLYQEGAPTADIRRLCDVTSSTLYRVVDGIMAPGEPACEPLPRRKRPRQPTLPRVPRRGLVNRLWHAASRQVCAIEERLAAADQAPAERERDARMLAVLVKTLAGLTALDDERAVTRKSGKPDAPVPPDDHDDIDELRRGIADRLAALAAGEGEGAAGDAEPARD